MTPDFGRLANVQYQLEGAFRNVHTRLRTHAESVAFFGGGAKEGAIVAATFDSLMRHLRHVATARWAHTVADEFFTKQLPNNVTWLLTLMYSLDQTGADLRTSRLLVMPPHPWRMMLTYTDHTAVGAALAQLRCLGFRQ